MALKVLSHEELTGKVGVIMGTRPGIIKMSPVVRALQRRKAPFFIIHTGQHYSYEMDATFFEDLGLPKPLHHLDTVRNSKTHAGQTAEMLRGVESALLIEKPRVLLVGGDANTNLSGALAARKLQITVAHMEAGLRSDDWRMPEEHNRVMIDHISEWLFAPTEQARRNMVEDNVRGNIVVVGNTIVDAVHQNLEIARNRSQLLSELNVQPRKYFLLTAHREENVDRPELLESLLRSAEGIASRYPDWPILFPVHPRTSERLREYGLEELAKSVSTLRLVRPMGYLDFLFLLSECRLVMTDSGGIQEEACILQRPCVTLRDNTERPETVEVGANEIAGLEPQNVIRAVEKMLAVAPTWPNPFGDGHAADRIAETLSGIANGEITSEIPERQFVAG